MNPFSMLQWHYTFTLAITANWKLNLLPWKVRSQFFPHSECILPPTGAWGDMCAKFEYMRRINLQKELCPKILSVMCASGKTTFKVKFMIGDECSERIYFSKKKKTNKLKTLLSPLPKHIHPTNVWFTCVSLKQGFK